METGDPSNPTWRMYPRNPGEGAMVMRDLHTGTMRWVWCNRCRSETGFETEILCVTDDGVLPMSVITGCLRCAPYPEKTGEDDNDG